VAHKTDLPGWLHLIATARELAAAPVMRDRKIIAYGEQGNV